LSQAARRFPLVARQRPVCRPLAERIQEITDLARTSNQSADTADGLAAAAAAQNRAALIASDCGMPDLAASLCRQQYELYMDARPLTAQTAKYALEPLINLSRLLMRAGDPEAASNQLKELYRAVRTRGSARIGGRDLPLGDLTCSGHEHRDLCQWLWGVMLADGLRALAAAGSWERAVAFAQQHRGVGRRLLDGRQAMIIAQALTGKPESALSCVEQSSTSEVWEEAVAACLAMLCRRAAGRPPSTADTAAVDKYLALEQIPELTTFRVRVALTAICLSGSDSGPIVSRSASEIPEIEDGYVAQERRRSPDLKGKLTASQQDQLFLAVKSAGLGQGRIPEPLHTKLLNAAEESRRAAAKVLQIHPAA